MKTRHTPSLSSQPDDDPPRGDNADTTIHCTLESIHPHYSMWATLLSEKIVPLLAEELNNLNNQSMMQPSAFRIPAKDDKGPMDIGISDHKATPIRRSRGGGDQGNSHQDEQQPDRRGCKLQSGPDGQSSRHRGHCKSKSTTSMMDRIPKVVTALNSEKNLHPQLTRRRTVESPSPPGIPMTLMTNQVQRTPRKLAI